MDKFLKRKPHDEIMMKSELRGRYSYRDRRDCSEKQIKKI